MGRRDELEVNLRRVRAEIAAACAAAGRDPGEVTLVAVTKTYPAADVEHLAALGVTEVGENRDQEAAPKAAAVTAAGVAVRWHFVGQLQRNKCKSVVKYADVVQSVDGVRLATALAEAARRHQNDTSDQAGEQKRDRVVEVLVQISLDGDASRGGAVAGSANDVDVELDRVLAAVAEADSLELRGLMAVAPLGWSPERAFAQLADIAAKVRVRYPSATELSAGMSGDFGLAIHYGATLVRIGSALLGNRPTLM
jgi:pyridoxal phosphate enzyme (YggS family)